MYKIYIRLKGKNTFIPYTVVQDEKVVEYETNDFIELTDKYTELLDIYPKNDLRAVKDYSAEISLMLNEIDNVKSIKKLDDYLYDITYDKLDYRYANDWLKEHNPFDSNFGCTSVRKGNLYGRNYDWYYNYQPTFIVHTNSTDVKIGSTCLCTGFGDLVGEFVDERKRSNLYKVLPFVVLDGKNDAGVVCNINVVPAGDWGETTGTVPQVEKLQELSIFMVLRYVLDNFDSATKAVEYLRDYCSIYAYKGFESHYMIADSTKTYIVEILNNEIEIIDVTNTRPYMTNFYIKDSVVSGNLVDRASLTPYGSGVERYEVIINNYDDIEDVDGMIDLMHNKLRYTNAYNNDTDPYWYTEFVSNTKEFGNLTVLSPSEDFEDIVAYGQGLYEKRTRDISNTWQSVHSVVYDLDNNIMYVIVQESDNIHTISL